MVTVYTLVVVLLADGGVTSYSRTFPTEYACQIAQEMTREAVPRALGVLDAGTICIKSQLNPDLKPRA